MCVCVCKQGDIPNLMIFFFIYFAITLSYTFQDCNIGVYIYFRITDKIFDLLCFNTKSKNLQTFAKKLLYADGMSLVAHSKEDMQHIMDLFSRTCTAFGLKCGSWDTA